MFEPQRYDKTHKYIPATDLCNFYILQNFLLTSTVTILALRKGADVRDYEEDSETQVEKYAGHR